MSTADRYTYRVRWSAEDGEHLATVAEFPPLSWLATDASDAFTGILSLVTEVIADMDAAAETVPVPLDERRYSGVFHVRIPPEAHRQLAIESAEQGISLNRLAAHRLVAS
ncbi:MAG: type II toxin-antitoxin system HicB family antitoxin [Promicromonosporaceae bacterium]|nr:type II toxin-antitoxin system HicB family antitoxin [Promicromonosporaceae bacterium]